MGKKRLEELAPNAGVAVGEFKEEFVVSPVFDADGVQASSGIGSNGMEYPDPVPMSASLDVAPPVPLMDMMRAMVERLKHPVNDFDIDETEEEANDFTTEEDIPDPLTTFEEVFVPKVPPVVPVAALKPAEPVALSGKEAAVPPVVESVKPT